MAASGSFAVLKMPKLIAMAHIRRPSGPAGCGSARWLASASSRALRSFASVALATAFSIAKVMDGPVEAVRVHQALHDAVAVGGPIPALAHAVEVVLRPIQRGGGRLGLVERGWQLHVVLLEDVAPDVP